LGTKPRGLQKNAVAGGEIQFLPEKKGLKVSIILCPPERKGLPKKKREKSGGVGVPKKKGAPLKTHTRRDNPKINPRWWKGLAVQRVHLGPTQKGEKAGPRPNSLELNPP